MGARQGRVDVNSWLAMLSLAATLALGACGQRDDVATGFPNGSCVTFSSSSNGNDSHIKKVECSAEHTHVVVDWVIRNSRCPADTDAVFSTPDGTLCLRADPRPSTTP
jgi:hypothetical protein